MEYYCVDSGRAMLPEHGQQCLAHMDTEMPCYISERLPHCSHPVPDPKHKGRCLECGLKITKDENESI